MFIIRADGNGKIGMGHVMRCMSVAYELKKAGENPIFFTACEESKNTIEKNGFDVHLLPTVYSEMETEIPYISELLKVLNNNETSVILLDSYFITPEYVMRLREFARIALIEDLGVSMPVDLIINYNMYAGRLKYEPASGIRQRVLLGTDYMPLRQEFSDDLSYELRPQVKNVMLTTGGSDPLFASGAFLNAFLEKEKNIKLHVVSGPYNTFADRLKKIYAENEQVVIHENVVSMKKLMKACDIVVSAAGSTVYEVCALGVPLIAFHFAENQRLIDETLPVLLPVKSAGDFAKNPEYTAKCAAEILTEYINDKKLREQLYENERKMVDGRGAKRIAAALTGLK